MRVLTCRVHGGQFKVQMGPGRSPTRCSDANPCDNVPATPPRRRTRAVKVELVPRAPRSVKARRAQQKATPEVIKPNPSVPLAFDARRLLEPEGWKITGRAYWDEDDQGVAVVTGSRGKEIITLTWINAKLVSQDYAMFQSDKPSLDGMPKPRLSFSTDEISDVALIRELTGKKVTWWNRTGRSKETASFPHVYEKVKIERLISGAGTDVVEKRVVSFVDQAGTGYRAFDLAALLKVV